jgi:hypothetical protein
MRCGTRVWSKYLSKYNLKIYIATRESCGRNLNFGEILNMIENLWEFMKRKIHRKPNTGQTLIQAVQEM